MAEAALAAFRSIGIGLDLALFDLGKAIQDFGCHRNCSSRYSLQVGKSSP